MEESSSGRDNESVHRQRILLTLAHLAAHSAACLHSQKQWLMVYEC